MKKINTVYVECFAHIWDYYFRQDDLLYTPSVLIGEERQSFITNLKSTKFYNREHANNLDIEINYDLSSEELKIIDEISGSIILFKMFHRNLLDKELNKKLYKELVTEYCRFWFYLIKNHNLEALILHEMPHIPYSYIGYLIFRQLGLVTIFSSTFPIRGKSYLTDSIENYSLFSGSNGVVSKPDRNDTDEDQIYYEKLVKEFSIPKYQDSNLNPSFPKVLLITLRNILFPQRSKRLQFKVIYKNKFAMVSDRKYHLFTLSRIIKKYFDKKLYIKLSADFDENTAKLKIFFALHFEPELAVYPLAGENFNQFDIIRELSSKIGNKGIIYIKEHPWVFDFSKPKGIIRGKDFYKVLTDLQNVKIINYSADVSKLINKIDLMVTLTGTIGWEASLLKIPVLYYGYPWYAGLPGTKKYFPAINPLQFISQCKNEYKFTDNKKVYEIMKNSLMDVTTKMYGLSKKDFQAKALILKASIEKFDTIRRISID